MDDMITIRLEGGDIDDLIVMWPDGTCCRLNELEDYLQFMSDDYEILF